LLGGGVYPALDSLESFCEVADGEVEDHVWFEDRWMVAAWCDE
jgi:hypothetical protein